MNATGSPPPLHRAALQVALVLAACVAVYWLGLSWAGLAYTEGHRAIPGFELLQRVRDQGLSRRALLVTTLFDQPYLRKPPMMPWGVALSSSVLGPTEFAARAVSALAMTLGALASWWFARRWFGPPWALAAGLAHALTPLFWQTGRAAEIEALHNLFIQLAALASIDLFVRRPESRATRRLLAAGAALAVLAAAWTKGPVGAPVLLAAALACGACSSAGWRALLPAFLLAAIPAGVAAQLWRSTLDLASSTGVAPVTQGVSEFLWAADRVGRVLLLPLAALASALPTSAALLFPFGPDARREAGTDGDLARLRLARAVALACLLSLALYAALGVSNPRYTMPAFALAAPAVAWALRARGTTFTPRRRRIAAWILLGRPAHLLALLLVAAAVYLPLYERSRARNSGRDAGMALGAALPAGTLHADALIDARPEILWYARRANPDLHVRWTPGWIPPPTDLVALLRAGGRDERPTVFPSAATPPLASGRVARFVFEVRRALPDPEQGSPDSHGAGAP